MFRKILFCDGTIFEFYGAHGSLRNMKKATCVFDLLMKSKNEDIPISKSMTYYLFNYEHGLLNRYTSSSKHIMAFGMYDNASFTTRMKKSPHPYAPEEVALAFESYKQYLYT